jgi:hypothetical protein
LDETGVSPETHWKELKYVPEPSMESRMNHVSFSSSDQGRILLGLREERSVRPYRMTGPTLRNSGTTARNKRK